LSYDSCQAIKSPIWSTSQCFVHHHQSHFPFKWG